MKKVLIFLSLFGCVISCTKDLEITQPIKQVSTQGREKAIYFTPYFDWQANDFISCSGGPQLLPWRSGSSGNVPDEIFNDNSREDGWVLLYNTCNQTQFANDYLIFYNIFRGVMRVYYWATESATATNVNWVLKYLGTSPVSTQNFVNQFSDPSTIKKTDVMQNNLNYTNSVIASIYKGWNCVDFEVSYDKNIPNLTYTQTAFGLYPYQTNITKANISGFSNGTIKGEMTSSSQQSNAPLLNSLLKIGAKAGAGYIMGTDFLKSIKNDVIKSAITNNGVDALIGSDCLGKIFNSIIGTHSVTNTTTVKLTTYEKISLEGTLSTITPSNVKPWQNGYIPGQSKTGVNGLISYYDKNLGVFNIDNTPTIVVNKNCPLGQRNGKWTIQQMYWIDLKSFNLELNPVVINESSSIQASAELWWYPLYNPMLGMGLPPSEIYNAWGMTLTLDGSNITIYQGPSNGLSDPTSARINLERFYTGSVPNPPTMVPITTYDNRFVVKIIVKITPKSNTNCLLDGTARDPIKVYNTQPITIVKTFIPKYVVK